MAGVRIALNLMVVLLVGAARADAQSSPIQLTNPTFQSSLERITKHSALWRQALSDVHATGRRIVVTTPDQVVVAGGSGRDLDRFDEGFLAEVAPVMGDGGRIDVVLVVVNLALLQERHRQQQLLPIEFDLDLDRILVHEIYGHAVPYLLAGDASGRCADPQPRERAVDACSIRRENAVRAELRLGRRVDYGLDGLNIARRVRY